MAILLLAGPLPAQFTGGPGDGNGLVLETNPDPCIFFEGGIADGMGLLLLDNSDSCGYFEGSSADGLALGLFTNPDTCGYFEGSNADGAGEVLFASPVPCPTFYGAPADGFGSALLNCTPLVVEASELMGRIEGTYGYLWWYTEMETNNLGFSVQKSRDRVEWTEIGFLEGKGQSEERVKYALWDRQMRSGVNYYRWQQMDYDGTTTISNVVALVRGETGAYTLEVYPVPIASGESLQLFFQAPETGALHWQFVDQTGRVVNQSQENMLENEWRGEIPTAGLASGVYVVMVDLRGKRLVRRVIVE